MNRFDTNIIGQSLDSGSARSRARGGPLLPLLLIGSATVLALILVIWINLPSLKRGIISQIKSGDLNGAYDLYLTSKSELGETDLKEIASVVLPAAESKCDQMMLRLKQEATDSDWSEAARLYVWMNELKPDPIYSARAFFAQARLAFSRKDYNKAIENYRKSIEIEPSSALALNGLGRAYWGQKDGEKAKEFYQRAIQAEPGWAYPYMNLGGLYLEMNDYPAAEQTLQKALTIDSKGATARNLLGQIYEKMSRWCDAYNQYSLAIEKAGGDASSISADAIRGKMSRLQSHYGCGH